MSGKKTKSVLVETPMKNAFKSLGLILLAMLVAFGLWNVCMKQLGKLLLSIDSISDK